MSVELLGLKFSEENILAAGEFNHTRGIAILPDLQAAAKNSRSFASANAKHDSKETVKNKNTFFT
jgi:hypothetical protein